MINWMLLLKEKRFLLFGAACGSSCFNLCPDGNTWNGIFYLLCRSQPRMWGKLSVTSSWEWVAVHLPKVAMVRVHSCHDLLIPAFEIELIVKVIYPACPAACSGRVVFKFVAFVFEGSISSTSVVKAGNWRDKTVSSAIDVKMTIKITVFCGSSQCSTCWVFRSAILESETAVFVLQCIREVRPDWQVGSHGYSLRYPSIRTRLEWWELTPQMAARSPVVWTNSAERLEVHEFM